MFAKTIHLVVEPVHAGQRLDRYIADMVQEVSRSYVQKLLDEGHIHINQREGKAAQQIKPGDVIMIFCPPVQNVDIMPETLPLDIVYEDDDVVVINKTAGMVVHPAPGHHSGTLVNALLARYPDMQISGDLRPGIVHRLDQNTSGLIVVARHDRAMHSLTEQQKAHRMYKAYLCVVEGRFNEPTGMIDAPLGRHPKDRKRQAVVAEGREARTHYHVLEDLGNYTLLRVVLETGRTHQIRVHMAYKQRPVLADPLYGPRHHGPTFGLTRQFLHAAILGFYYHLTICGVNMCHLCPRIWKWP
jgi:23S rRNA pseudouridine1911/1915/1917 synthase